MRSVWQQTEDLFMAINEKDSRTMSAVRAEKYVYAKQKEIFKILGIRSAADSPLIRKADYVQIRLWSKANVRISPRPERS